MAPHQYGRYLHVLTQAGADGAHGGPQPWEGITGRVKQETNRLMVEMNSRADSNQEAIKSVEAQLGDVKAQLGDVQSKLEASNQVLLTELAELKTLLQQLAKAPPQDA